MKSLSFDGMAERYDETRIFDQDCFDSALDFLVKRFPPQTFRKVFEPGIGTGRIAIPLAERGYRVTGVDISEEMLAALEDRLARSDRPLDVSCQKADLTELPFPDGAFDLAVAVHLFHLIRDWKKAADETLRVVRPDGPVILMHTGTGMEVPFLNDRYKALCANQGCPIRNIGAASAGDVADYYAGLGCRVEWVRDRWRWTSRIRLDKALAHYDSRTYSFTTIAPDDVHLKTMEMLRSELQRRFGTLSAEIEWPSQVYLAIILRQ